ncbi:fimbrial protein [Enterobacter ludwigii]
MFNKKNLLVITFAALMGSTGVTYAAQDEGNDGNPSADPVAPKTVYGGQVHFTGSLVDAPCSVDNDSASQTVKIGQFQTSKFDKTGATSAEKQFNIHLADCSVETYKNAQITFSGSTVQGDSKKLSLNGDGAGSATGVAIQLKDNKGEILGLDGNQPSSAQALTDGDSYLKFSAQYVSIADKVTAGKANSDVDFNITYN